MLREHQRKLDPLARELSRNVTPPHTRKNRVAIGPLHSKIPNAFYMPYYHFSWSVHFPPFDMSFNSSFIDSSGLNTTSQLYSSLNLDYTQLNWFERQWMAWYMWIGNPLLATGIASFILHEVCAPLPTLQRTASSSPYADCLFRSLLTMDHHR